MIQDCDTLSSKLNYELMDWIGSMMIPHLIFLQPCMQILEMLPVFWLNRGFNFPISENKCKWYLSATTRLSKKENKCCAKSFHLAENILSCVILTNGWRQIKIMQFSAERLHKVLYLYLSHTLFYRYDEEHKTITTDY